MGPRRKISLGSTPAGQAAKDITRSGKPSGLKNSQRPDGSPPPKKPPQKKKPFQTDQTSPKEQISEMATQSGSGLPPLRFPIECHLKNKKDIQAVFDQRDMVRGRKLVFYRKARVQGDPVPPQSGGAPGSLVGGVPNSGSQSELRLLHRPSQKLGHPRNDKALIEGQKGSKDSTAGIGSSGGSSQPGRFCLVVSKKCGIAVRRNRIKRILREILRQNLFRIRPGYDYIVVVMPSGLPEKINQEDFIGDFATYFGWK